MSANSRILLERAVMPALLERLRDRANRMQPADPLDPAPAMGAVVDETQTAQIMRFIESGKKA